MTSDSSSIMLYVTDIANLIGCNPHCTPEESILKIWKRIAPYSYQQAELTTGYQSDIDRASHLASSIPIDVGSGDVKSQMDSATKSVQESSLSDSDKMLVSSHVLSQIRTGYGVKMEMSAIQLYEIKHNVKVVLDPKFCSKSYDGKLYRFAIGGKIDGLNSSILIEVKNRLHKFMLPEYDRIQCQAYLQIWNLYECHLVECLRTNGISQINVTPIPRDDTYWKSILDKLHPMVEKVYKILFDAHLRETYLAHPEKRKSILDSL